MLTSASSHARKIQPTRAQRPRPARLFLLLVSCAFAFAACQVSPANPTGPVSSAKPEPSPAGQRGQWRLIFHDEFDGHTLDTSKWTTCYFDFKVGKQNCDHDNGELELYQPDNIAVSQGILTLRAEKKRVTAANGKTYFYTSGMISTGPSFSSAYDTRFSFTYGYMEMRARIPVGQGLWPAFWSMPTDLSWPPEIDIFEILGKAPHVVQMHYHYPGSTTKGSGIGAGGSWTGPDFSAGWHIYALDWEPDAITWYIDGIARATYTGASHITSKPMYLLANLAVGGDWPGNPTASTPFPALYQIDYVRVWQH